MNSREGSWWFPSHDSDQFTAHFLSLARRNAGLYTIIGDDDGLFFVGTGGRRSVSSPSPGLGNGQIWKDDDIHLY